MKIFVVMKQKVSPIFITDSKMHKAFASRGKAVEECRAKNQKAISNNYWVESVDLEGQ